jgi:hypothetical protein
MADDRLVNPAREPPRWRLSLNRPVGDLRHGGPEVGLEEDVVPWHAEIAPGVAEKRLVTWYMTCVRTMRHSFTPEGSRYPVKSVSCALERYIDPAIWFAGSCGT